MALFLAACAPAPAPAPSPGRNRPSVPPSPASSPLEQQILTAVREAYLLEEKLWAARDRIRTRDDLVGFFRQGFCEAEARRLAEYLWMGELEGTQPQGPPLRVGEPVLILPDELIVEAADDQRATVLLRYEARTEGPTVWPAQTVRLVVERVEGAWKICGFNAEEPSGTPPEEPEKKGE